MLGVLAFAGSFEAPRLAHAPLATATTELVGAPSAISHAVTQVADNVTGSHLGFDTNVYPGDKAMAAWKRSDLYEWVGYYLKTACHKDGSWSGTRSRLLDQGWGLAVIYVGQQTWGRKVRSTKTGKSSNVDCSSKYLTAKQGKLDAADAIAKATHEGFSPGTVIFLDLEYMDVIPHQMRDYYKAWTQAVLDNGMFRPGFYAHTHNATAIHADVKPLFAAAGVQGDPPFWIASEDGFSIDSPPTDVGHKFADVWQGMLDVVRTHNGVRLPIDISVAADASPSVAVQ